MEKISVAIWDYHDRDSKRILNLPSSSFPTFPTILKTAEGKPGLSWRVVILPNLGHKDLFDKFHLEEPWNSEHNLPLVKEMPSVYRSPMSKASEGFTNYLAITGAQSIMQSDKNVSSASVRDGTRHTISFVEVDDELATQWTKPQDFQWQPEKPASGLGGLHPKGAFLAGFVDGSIHFIKNTTDSVTLRAMYTRSGGEVEPNNWWNENVGEKKR